MPKLLNMVLCRQAYIDQMTNSLTISDVAEEIGVPKSAFDSASAGNPAFAGPITLVALFSWQWPKSETPGIIKVDLYVKTPKGDKHLIRDGMDINTPVPLPRCRLVAKIGGFPIDIPGIYVFVLEVRGKNVAEVPLEIISLDMRVPSELIPNLQSDAPEKSRAKKTGSVKSSVKASSSTTKKRALLKKG